MKLKEQIGTIACVLVSLRAFRAQNVELSNAYEFYLLTDDLDELYRHLKEKQAKKVEAKQSKVVEETPLRSYNGIITYVDAISEDPILKELKEVNTNIQGLAESIQMVMNDKEDPIRCYDDPNRKLDIETMIKDLAVLAARHGITAKQYVDALNNNKGQL